tara:strand:+ start:81568 stop:81870 length:303 start_codon:yes stop_codon:yes gene_type:complete
MISISERTEIARLCSYITDDSTIAVYVGVPIADVRAIRKSLPPSSDARLRYLPQPAAEDAGPLGAVEETMRRKEARIGSERLLNAIRRYRDRRAQNGVAA